MTRTWRLLLATLLALVGLVAPSLPAQAAATGANAAARYLASTLVGETDDAYVASDVDALIGMAAANDAALQTDIDALLATVKAGAKTYATSGGRAAKLALVAQAYDLSPSAFGIDLVSLMKADIKADGSVGAYPSPFASGLTIIGLKAAGSEVPASVVTWMEGQQNPDGGFGWAKGQASDADNTALAILGLPAGAARDKAVAWAQASQNADGSWDGFSPVNSTAILGGALSDLGLDVSKAKAYVAAHQNADGGLNTGAANAPTTSDLMATEQGILLLGDASFASVRWQAKQTPTTKPTVTPTEASPTVQPTTPADNPTKPAPTSGPTTGRGVPAHTGDEGTPLAAYSLLGALIVLAAGIVKAA